MITVYLCTNCNSGLFGGSDILNFHQRLGLRPQTPTSEITFYLEPPFFEILRTGLLAQLDLQVQYHVNATYRLGWTHTHTAIRGSTLEFGY